MAAGVDHRIGAEGGPGGIRDGRVKKGDLVLMEAFGGGFTWGSILMRY